MSRADMARHTLAAYAMPSLFYVDMLSAMLIYVATPPAIRLPRAIDMMSPMPALACRHFAADATIFFFFFMLILRCFSDV